MIAAPADLISLREAARVLRCHYSTVSRYVKRGQLAAVKRAEQHRLVSRADVLALLQPVARPAAKRSKVKAKKARKDAMAELRRAGYDV